MKQLSITFIFIIIFSRFASADIAVLVHGYHSNSNIWHNSGISQYLHQTGWHDAGVYRPSGWFNPNHYSLDNSNNYTISVELPSEAPIEVQSQLLSNYLWMIHQYVPQQNIRLIAHSAGGIVSRLSLVNFYQLSQKKNQTASIPNIVQLITIATPHLGSPIAEMAEQASNSPIGIIAPFIGANEINRARHLYKQLSREEENVFLFWLNRQTHPSISYTSIIRANNSLLKGDWLVPSSSQDMRLVPAIGNRANYFLSLGDHNLHYRDGFIIRNLLNKIK